MLAVGGDVKMLGDSLGRETAAILCSHLSLHLVYSVHLSMLLYMYMARLSKSRHQVRLKMLQIEWLVQKWGLYM